MAKAEAGPSPLLIRDDPLTSLVVVQFACCKRSRCTILSVITFFLVDLEIYQAKIRTGRP